MCAKRLQMLSTEQKDFDKVLIEISLKCLLELLKNIWNTENY